ncbi:MAG: glycosyltransferase family 2 protein [Gaiellaceae bacterium]
MRRVLFWGAGLVLGWTYVLFPLVLLARGALVHRPWHEDDSEPELTIVVSAYNEEAVIAAKLDSLVTADYPPERREILVASDGSDDATNEIVAGYAGRGVRLLALERSGKAAALNRAVGQARGELLVFTDANSIFDAGALRALVRPFADRTVGGVAGDQRYALPKRADGAAVGERRYWDLDRLFKVQASRAGNAIGATGAIYALRRELFQPLLPDVNDDLLNSLRVIAAGRRLVFAGDAVAYEDVSASAEQEFARKVRVMVRGLRCVWVMRETLDPRRTGFYALHLLTQKVLLRTMVVPLAVLAASSVSLWRRGALYKLATVGQAVLYAAGAAGVALGDRPAGRSKLLALPGYFVLVNAASAVALWKLVRRERSGLWETKR